MMSLSGTGGGSDAAGYYQKDNYYTRDQASEASGWLGKGAEELGLKGAVDEKVFADVLDGKLPNGDVIKSPSGEHRAGWDITLSAPKSISLVALVGGDKRIEIAMRDSVEATLAWVEKNLIESRIWDKEVGQQVPAKTGNLVAASFVHDVNRNNEPQLHVHNAIANASLAPDGKWHAVRNEALYDNQHLIGSIHSADLRARIAAKIAQARSQGATFIVIDTPPHADLAASKAVEAADLVLIPCRPSAFDLAAIRTSGQLVKLHGKPAALLFTAGPVRAPKIYADATTLVKSFGIEVCPHVIADRAAFRHASAAGQTVFEFQSEGRAAAEITAVHMWLCEQVNTFTSPQARRRTL
jgi:conjugative relaxase-like TrwC/TraI family protein